MMNILLRTVILYIAVLFIIRAMGKGELSKLDPFQVVILFMIAELAAYPIETPDISIVTGLTALLTLLFLQVIFSIFSMKSLKFKNIISGKASIIIEKGKINEKEMRRLRITADDLTEQLRLKNYPSIADLDYAILEANGDMSVIPRPEKNPVTREDLGIKPGEEDLPLVLIADGKIYQRNLQKLNKDDDFIKNELSKQGYGDLSKVFLCYSDQNGRLHVYPQLNSIQGRRSEDKDTEGWDVE